MGDPVWSARKVVKLSTSTTILFNDIIAMGEAVILVSKELVRSHRVSSMWDQRGSPSAQMPAGKSPTPFLTETDLIQIIHEIKANGFMENSAKN